MAWNQKQAPADLLVIIPGIGGSKLEDDGGTTLWGGHLGSFALNALVPDALHLEASPHLNPRGLLSTARSLPGFGSVHPYDNLIRELGRRFELCLDRADAEPKLDAGAFVFAYDFRRSIVESAELLDRQVRARLNHLAGRGAEAPSSSGRVAVIAHSMGGLIARYWLAEFEVGRLCRQLYTLGTPHRGVPKALEWLVNGAHIKGIEHSALSDVVRSWDSVYELLPRYPMLADESGQLRRPYEVDHDHLGRRAAAAFQTHQLIEAAWSSPSGDLQTVIPFSGEGHPTSLIATLVGRRVVMGKESVDVDPDGRRGDGTVPFVSAIPIEMDLAAGDERRDDIMDRLNPTGKRHGELGSVQDVVHKLAVLWGQPTDRLRGLPVDARAIALDIAETELAGKPFVVGGSLRVDGSPAPTSLKGTIRPEGRPDLQEILAFEFDGEWQVASVNGLEPGVYRVEVGSADESHHVDPCREWVTVVAE